MKNKKKQPAVMVFFKAVLMVLTAVFPVLMASLAGAGIMSHRDTYGEDVWRMGLLLLAGGLVITGGAVCCLFRRSIMNLISAVFSLSGGALVLAMILKIADHADRAGWSDKYTMAPVSDMYKVRLLPCLIPAALALIIALVQYFSREASEERSSRRDAKKAKENAPAPKILDD